jgi:hypothetical protein
MTAQFKVLDGTQVINQYELEYSTSKELNDLHHEARKVWDEYMVEVHMEGGMVSFSHTHAEMVRRGWA